MTIRIIIPGKLSLYLKNVYNNYIDKLKRFVKIEVIFVQLGGNLNKENTSSIINKEEKNILEKIPKESYIVLLDVKGQQKSSMELAGIIEKNMNHSKNITFIIGGPCGINDSLRKKSDICLCLSKMTFTHETVLVLMLEQIFRSFKIIKGEPYNY